MSEVIAQSTSVEEKAQYKYLIFRVGSQFFGSPLEEITEVVEPFEITPSPNSPKEFLGMINLRGEIISVIDLRVVLGQKVERSPKMLMIIIGTENGKTAILVDELVEVHDFVAADIDSNPNLKSSIPKDSLIAVGKYRSKVVYLVRLEVLLGHGINREVV
ncbi:MAG: chemotaxis protein CheW [Bdellovibrionales bacterium]